MIKRKSYINYIALFSIKRNWTLFVIIIGFFIMVGIYKITSPSKKVYIGQSTNLERRFKDYEKNRSISQRRIYYSIQKYGFDKHKIEVIHQCKPDELDNLEIYYIQLYNSFNSKHGLNLRSGGNGGYLSEETKQKISEARIALNIKYDDAYKAAMSLKLSGENNPMFGMSGELSPNWGKKHKNITIKKMIENHANFKGQNNPNYGKPNTKEQIEKANRTKRIKLKERNGFYSFTINDKNYECLTYKDIADIFNVNQSSVRRQYIKKGSFRGFKITKTYI